MKKLLYLLLVLLLVSCAGYDYPVEINNKTNEPLVVKATINGEETFFDVPANSVYKLDKSIYMDEISDICVVKGAEPENSNSISNKYEVVQVGVEHFSITEKEMKTYVIKNYLELADIPTLYITEKDNRMGEYRDPNKITKVQIPADKTKVTTFDYYGDSAEFIIYDDNDEEVTSIGEYPINCSLESNTIVIY